MRDNLYSRVKVLSALDVSAITTSTTTNGTSLGLAESGQNFRSAVFILTLGARTDGTYTLVPQESADGSTGWANVPAARVLGSAALTAANGVGMVGVIPDPNVTAFLRMNVVSTVVTSGATGVRGVCLMSQGSVNPVQ